ncbi:23S rRNA (uridine(2552)-2'-O)-methyltransferase RlmE [Porticoccaceae bacterium]|jgi:23S rRNA (uridine2552-2'-O)-methyltransferase|nr:23S rRNA (uridine(2552)-2'-O)-methyltransferase RlmE [Porticoccaceae bacterium]MDA7769544.1 23S rRNA (uridine(2552)-2'-O)-methyltransferase RlmE [Porticoccaceae bacterium]MDA8598343.1 23S rRNA (uridine(2552)-2'-O)-methyltransferase RlmE [Porticoccaceae bacterium]MDA8878113.1 23S rRNA (uridine(2552)-2'-O)-methyltransferase RlmE [Porticoccaceae bacterium]MDA8941801.1 23S rRNA (uridine(2552)-2'-O)-methyltransferase RlmE [Porticoccaceae bacterium]|tara:strand:- start:517 stop:1137 length:621 start_codon:yes stop_codon:yes gene_type:complete
MAKSKNRSWIKQHVKDPYVKQSQVDGYRSRASYKLLEIVEKDRLIRSGMTVVDLGSAPGGWSQVAARLVGHTGRVHALDLLPMDSIAGVDFIQGDFTEEDIFDELLKLIENRPVDLVISDMAPNLSGNKAVDQPAVMYLAELAVELAEKVLTINGVFIAKLFQGQGFDPFVLQVRTLFNGVSIIKPDASRSRSREVYLVAKGLKAN